MATVGFNPGTFTVSFLNSSKGNWSEKIGYVHDNLLDSGATDTTAVATDLLSFADELTGLTEQGTMMGNADITYTATLQYD